MRMRRIFYASKLHFKAVIAPTSRDGLQELMSYELILLSPFA
jgi:hypothetical protein